MELLETNLEAKLRKAGAIQNSIERNFVGVKMPKTLVERLDSFVEKIEGGSRSGVIIVAVHEFLNKQEKILEKSREMEKQREKRRKKFL